MELQENMLYRRNSDRGNIGEKEGNHTKERTCTQIFTEESVVSWIAKAVCCCPLEKSP